MLYRDWLQKIYDVINITRLNRLTGGCLHKESLLFHCLFVLRAAQLGVSEVGEGPEANHDQLEVQNMVEKDQNLSEDGSTLDARSSAPVRPILNWSTHVAGLQVQTLFPTPSSQGCMEAANNQKPDTDVPRVHRQTATMWNNVNETDEEEFEDYVTKPAQLGEQAKTTEEQEHAHADSHIVEYCNI
jgi:hypothetical protein